MAAQAWHREKKSTMDYYKKLYQKTITKHNAGVSVMYLFIWLGCTRETRSSHSYSASTAVHPALAAIAARAGFRGTALVLVQEPVLLGRATRPYIVGLSFVSTALYESLLLIIITCRGNHTQGGFQWPVNKCMEWKLVGCLLVWVKVAAIIAVKSQKQWVGRSPPPSPLFCLYLYCHVWVITDRRLWSHTSFFSFSDSS